MISVNIHEAKTHFSKTHQPSFAGEKIVIAKGGIPLIVLTPYNEQLSPRKGGQLNGMIQIKDDFDAPLPDEILKQFYGKDDQ